MSSISPLPSRRSTSVLTTERMSSLRSTRMVSGASSSSRMFIFTRPTAERSTLRIEEQRLEHRLRGVERRRLARTHHPVDVEQRVLARDVLVDGERVADIGADIDVIDVEQRQLLVAELDQRLEVLLGDLLAGFGVDLAGFDV